MSNHDIEHVPLRAEEWPPSFSLIFDAYYHWLAIMWRGGYLNACACADKPDETSLIPRRSHDLQ